jgi:hypothetical protein
MTMYFPVTLGTDFSLKRNSHQIRNLQQSSAMFISHKADKSQIEK